MFLKLRIGYLEKRKAVKQQLVSQLKIAAELSSSSYYIDRFIKEDVKLAAIMFDLDRLKRTL